MKRAGKLLRRDANGMRTGTMSAFWLTPQIFSEGKVSLSSTSRPPGVTTPEAAPKSTASLANLPPQLQPGPQPPTPVGAAADPAAQMVVAQTVVEISPPGFVQTVTTHANGIISTVITNRVGEVVQSTTSHTATVGTIAGVAATTVDIWA